MNILLAEDEEGAVLITRRLLEEVVHRIDDTPTLAGALQLLGEIKYDVVILDLKLLDASRAETISSIPKIKEKAKVIAISGIDCRDECLRAGADAFIYKGHDGGGGALVAAIGAVIVSDRTGETPHVNILERLVGKEEPKKD